ncbi:hypothetical protein AWJ20_2738 [Sugiyamaella lignohabitans]|uniref:Thioredoxin-like fold domain-containing protein n=1 Tax=Sugiyamaella lignohabitans TaxID=796027 RepID=A0A167FCH0_9ASCO|nr:uncharacterized protein AWJ20_2738 [Sugiyamaella lignohabitans]ANB15118.1 hypothetical protein AWJ20_2738 [Sugiyamaella lignohabitans]
MSISPRYLSHRLGSGGAHTIEIYLDYVCPNSKRAFETLLKVFPEAEKANPGQFQFIFRHQIQPWHPSSTLVAEAGIAVAKLAPTKFWDFSAALFKESDQYYDEAVWNETRGQTYERLADLAHHSVGLEKTKFLDLVTVAPANPPKNAGNKLDKDVKAFVRQSRQNGIHFSPTVVVDGIIDPSIDSHFDVEKWLSKLQSIDEVSKA